ncbi:VOC family protein [Evansella sp. AB-rgal1]|uniref:VOC family protein n=1 Tax=Evansella sp. AB-rgal1 TaxID=3242696 RepID=UPI00359CDE32
MIFKLHHIGIEVENLSVAVKYYVEELGFHEKLSLEFFREKIVFLTNGDIFLELLETSSTEEGQPFHLALETKNMDAAIEFYKGVGVSLCEGPHLLDNGWITGFFADKNGWYFEVIETSGRHS